MVGLLVLLGAAGLLLTLGIAGATMVTAQRPPRRTMGHALAHGLPVDPAELGIPFESWDLRRPDGAVLHVWDLRPGRASPGTPVGILLHGWGSSRIDLLARVAPWLDRFQRLLLVDQRGHGSSTGPSTTIGRLETGDAIALVERLGDESVILVGWSMGAVVACRAAAALPAPVVGVVAVGAYPSGRRALDQRLREFGLPVHPLGDLAWWGLSMLGAAPIGLPRPPMVPSAPVLCLHGTDDALATLEALQEWVETLPDGTVVPVEGAGHLGEAIDEAVGGEVVDRFLRRVSPSGSSSPTHRATGRAEPDR